MASGIVAIGAMTGLPSWSAARLPPCVLLVLLPTTMALPPMGT